MPLKIAGAPVVMPVEYGWPLTAGVEPPPDPRPIPKIDCTASLSLNVVRDLYSTFKDSLGFYLFINGLLQITVPDDFDTAWASSHQPHRFGGLNICYISQTMESLPSAAETTSSRPLLRNTVLSALVRRSRQLIALPNPVLRLHDFIEARSTAKYQRKKYGGRIGLTVIKDGEPYLVMSNNIVEDATPANSSRETSFHRLCSRAETLQEDRNEHVNIWAGNERIGTIDKNFDMEARTRLNRFHHDIKLVKPLAHTSISRAASPVSNLGWLCRDSWKSLRELKYLAPTEGSSISCGQGPEILVVGQGIFLSQSASARSFKSLDDHDVSRALLYRVHPDLDLPSGHSGIALYADGEREDGSHGPGIVGFRSFAQRFQPMQDGNTKGPNMDEGSRAGRVAFYGAFEVPGMLKREYTVV